MERLAQRVLVSIRAHSKTEGERVKEKGHSCAKCLQTEETRAGLQSQGAGD